MEANFDCNKYFGEDGKKVHYGNFLRDLENAPDWVRMVLTQCAGIRSTWNPDLVLERHTEYLSILRAAYHGPGSVTVFARYFDSRTHIYSIVMWCNEKLLCLMAEKNEILIFLSRSQTDFHLRQFWRAIAAEISAWNWVVQFVL